MFKNNQKNRYNLFQQLYMSSSSVLDIDISIGDVHIVIALCIKFYNRSYCVLDSPNCFMYFIRTNYYNHFHQYFVYVFTFTHYGGCYFIDEVPKLIIYNLITLQLNIFYISYVFMLYTY